VLLSLKYGRVDGVHIEIGVPKGERGAALSHDFFRDREVRCSAARRRRQRRLPTPLDARIACRTPRRMHAPFVVVALSVRGHHEFRCHSLGTGGDWQPADATGSGQAPIMPVHQEPHHRQVFQRGPMRILGLQIPPGDVSWFHTHEWPV